MKVLLCVFDKKNETQHVLTQRAGDVHFDFIGGLKPGTRYGFRVEGPWAPELGLRYDPSKLLVDPFAWSLDQPFVYHESLSQRGTDTAALVPKCIIENPLPDVPRPKYRKPEFIYELAIKAFTKLHPQVPEHKRGTMGALTEPAIIAHLKNIGVDTLELMPITAWIDERHLKPLGLHNAWGYNPIQFFSPDPRLAPGGMMEIRETVQELHRQGFRVILDIVLNHSGESDQFGPTLCFRGLDSPVYYAHARSELINDTGCGNTLALNDPHVVEMVIAALRHWVLKAGVDGFRFDLATVMGRMTNGFRADAPLLQAIEKDDVLSTCVMIAEPWDIGPGGYQLGQFPKRWLEWNDRFRDDMRKFWRGDDYAANGFATRLTGSSDIFGHGRQPSNSVNFFSAHDGFTLRDLVTYADKNNLNNGEDNRDGKSNEVTWQGGNVATLLATLLLSRGTPMLTAGDEFGRTQKGNNNAYAQDNEITWLDWTARDDQQIENVAKLMCLRRDKAAVNDDEFLTDANATWFRQDGQVMNWSDPHQRFVGLLLTSGNQRIAIIANGSARVEKITIPNIKNKEWRQLYSSANEENCSANSITLFEEI
jgi:glycogen debranching enzyme